MVYFTSDFHFGHNAIIRMQNRPFADAAEMNEALIQNYNARVGNNDVVYILGDVSHRIPQEQTDALISRLRGKKTLVIGNHDKHVNASLYEEVCDFKCVSLSGFYFALMHYPMASWPRSCHGSTQLHGHCHFDREYNMANQQHGLRRYDVGVDANLFTPVSVEEIISFFDLRKETSTFVIPDFRLTPIADKEKEERHD